MLLLSFLVDCELSDWGAFGECSVTCGEGIKTKTRTTIASPEHGGQACGDLSLNQTCNPDPCPSK